MMRPIRIVAHLTVAVGLLACSGKAVSEFPGEGGGGAGTGTGSGTAGSGGDHCNCSVGAYVPVCGIDGTTYDAACGIECVPVDIECEGACPCVDCDELEEQYRDALTAARACSPFIDMVQCTEQVDSELACPCPTFVNPTNAAAMSTLETLRAQWTALGCDQGIGCPEIPCPVPFGGVCTPQAGSGDVASCVDDFGVSGDSGSGK